MQPVALHRNDRYNLPNQICLLRVEEVEAFLILCDSMDDTDFWEKEKILMGTSRKLTEVQLADAKKSLELHSASLEKNGMSPDVMKRNTLWRKLNAKRRQIGARLRRIGETEALNVEVARLKDARLAALAAPVEEPAPKPKKEKAAPKAAKPTAEEKSRSKERGPKEKDKGAKKK